MKTERLSFSWPRYPGRIRKAERVGENKGSSQGGERKTFIINWSPTNRIPTDVTRNDACVDSVADKNREESESELFQKVTREKNR